jgi:putative transposase
VLPGVPHHVTHRGNHRERVFFSPGDPEAYLYLLREHAQRHAITIAAYCLMPNHVHLVAIPSTPEGLYRALKAIHGQYAQRVNRMRDQSGHLWQGRFFSSPLDACYFLNATRYVELNPVRAGMVSIADEYPWSSAAAHCGLRNDPIVEAHPPHSVLSGITNWSRWLAEGVADEISRTLRLHASQNLPCGSPEFMARVEQAAGRKLQFRSPGRPKKTMQKQKGRLPNQESAHTQLHSENGERPLFEKVNVPFFTS